MCPLTRPHRTHAPRRPALCFLTATGRFPGPAETREQGPGGRWSWAAASPVGADTGAGVTPLPRFLRKAFQPFTGEWDGSFS